MYIAHQNNNLNNLNFQPFNHMDFYYIPTTRYMVQWKSLYIKFPHYDYWYVIYYFWNCVLINCIYVLHVRLIGLDLLYSSWTWLVSIKVQ